MDNAFAIAGIIVSCYSRSFLLLVLQ